MRWCPSGFGEERNKKLRATGRLSGEQYVTLRLALGRAVGPPPTPTSPLAPTGNPSLFEPELHGSRDHPEEEFGSLSVVSVSLSA